MEVAVWGSDWGIASIDPRCLQMMTYAKFSGAPLHVKYSNNPFWTPQGDLPVYNHASTVKNVTEFGPFVQHLRNCKFSANYNLTSKQLSEVSALSQLIDEKLYPAYLFIFWIDAKNSVELVRPWFAKNMRFPLNMIYPSRYHRRACDVIESRFGCTEDDPVTETAVYKSAEETLTLLSKRLGTEPYLFGKSPTSADAVLYAHLAPILKAPLPNPSLQNHLKACTNLVAFVGRVTQNYFSQISLDYEKKMKKISDDEKSSKNFVLATVETFKSKEFLNRLVSCLVAGCAMVAYAHFSGLLNDFRNIEVTYEDIEDDEDETDSEE